MELTILNYRFEDLYFIDEYESIIWTERYYSPGDFELNTAVNDYMLKAAQLIRESMEQRRDVYVWTGDSDTSMLVENIEIKTDLDTGTRFILTGRSLLSIMDRRIVWEQTILDGKLEGQVKKLITESIINPKLPERKIEEVIFVESGDSRFDELTIRAQYTGDNLLEVLEKIGETYHIGYKTWITDENKIAFQLYMGEDRSYDQNRNQEVIFSTQFENLLNTNYLESIKTLKNVALVAGEDEAQNRRTITIGEASGLQRRELYVDARDIQSTKEDGTAISETEYNAQLKQRGDEDLAENKYIKAFDGGIETNQTFQYGRDFFKGDIVQLSNEYGIDGKVRILEVIRSQDGTGLKMYPTFEVVEEE